MRHQSQEVKGKKGREPAQAVVALVSQLQWVARRMAMAPSLSSVIVVMWKKEILMGERCQPLGFSGVTLQRRATTSRTCCPRSPMHNTLPTPQPNLRGEAWQRPDLIGIDERGSREGEELMKETLRREMGRRGVQERGRSTRSSPEEEAAQGRRRQMRAAHSIWRSRAVPDMREYSLRKRFCSTSFQTKHALH
jgi:hypothetical protein